MSDSQQPFQLPAPEEMEELLPSYSNISFLAQGGMAAVFKGVQTSLDRQIAIKVLPREFGTDESFRMRFGAEAKTMAKLNHPNLVSIFDFGEVQGLLYLIMEFVEGQTLYHYAYQKKLEEVEALKFAVGVANGLAHAHENEILHRDIKPSNILLDEKNNPKLGDFGLAQGGEREEGDDLVFGTPGYTSPEVLADPHCADQRADIYAVGVLLYELLTAELPTDPYNPPSRLVKSDPRIDAVIARCLQPDPAHRYPTAGELAADLKKVYDQVKNSPRTRLATATKGSGPARSLKVEPKKANPKALAAGGGESGGAKVATPPPGGKPSPQISSSSSEGSFTMARNVIIILGLCGAIWGAWTVLQKKKADVAEKQAIIDAEAAKEKRIKEAEVEARRLAREKELAALAAQNQSSRPSSNSSNAIPDLPPEPEVILTPLEQLAEMKDDLAAGSRNNYPDGTQQRGSSSYFFVETPMTWYEALEFAENHGGHLAVVPSDSDLTWIRTLITSGDQIWLGAGATARSGWAWVDNSVDFKNQKLSTSVGTAASVKKFSPIKGTKPSEKLPFVIEWAQDGSNNGSRTAQLVHLMENLDSRDANWPPGTLALEERRYLIVARPMTLAEAQAYAESYQAHLAVPSSEIEASFLRDSAALSGLNHIWLGGEKSGTSWTWLSNEPWTFARWADSFPSESSNLTGLVITANGWENVDANEKAQGFIIEWSDDSKKTEDTGEVVTTDSSAELEKLQRIAKQVIAQEQQEFIKKMKSNTGAQGSMVRQFIRGMAKEDGERLTPVYEAYVATIDVGTGRLPNPDSVEQMSSFPTKVAELLEQFYETQSNYDSELLSSATRLRASYLSKIQASVSELEAKGLKSQTGIFEIEIEAIGKTGSTFLDRFNANPLK